MAETYRPFRNIRTPENLLLIRREIRRPPVSERVPEAYYPEISAWVTIRCDEDELFADEGQTLLEGTVEDGHGWRLSLTGHGYLRFESTGEEPFVCESGLPVHAAVDARRTFRLGLSLSNYAWCLRHRPYAVEGSADFRLHLLAGQGPSGEMMRIGGTGEVPSPELAPAPERLHVGASADGSGRFAGRISAVTAFNTSRERLVCAPWRRSATRLVPPVPGGGGFAARWLDDETVEVFTRPSFNLSSSYWVLLRLPDDAPEMKRLLVHVKWAGGVNMSPTFFFSPDRRRWRRVVPERMWQGDGRTDYRVRFELSAAMRRGGWLASGPVFGEPEREELLEWAAGQQYTTVSEVARSVEDRPIHLIRMGAGDDGPGRRGVAIICGQHSPLEIMTAHSIRPMMREILRSPGLLEAANFYFVPTVNVDAAHYGGNGLNVNRCNLNRHWLIDPEPENSGLIACFDELAERGQGFDLAIDMHAGGIFRNHVLMHMGDGAGATLSGEAIGRQDHWRELLERHAGLRGRDARPMPQLLLRATDYFHQVHGATAFCLELGSCTWFDPEEQRTRGFSARAFEVLGRGMARACEQRFGAPGD